MTRLLPALVLLGTFALPDTARATPDEPEEVEEVQTVQTVQTSQTSKEGTLDLVGKLHPLLVHFPIAWLLLLGLVDALTFGLRRERWARAGLWLLVLSVVSATPTVVTGLLRGSGVQDPKQLALVIEHRNLALMTLTATVLALVLRLLRRNKLAGLWRLAYLALIAAAVGLVIATGHHGGMLVYGDNYFSF